MDLLMHDVDRSLNHLHIRDRSLDALTVIKTA